jgi:hypothetical protein
MEQDHDPLFGRKTWKYVDIMRGSARGPQPKMSKGTGRTGKPSPPGAAVYLPGHVSDNSYRMNPFTYAPQNNPNFLQRVPRSIGTGENGRGIVGTYQPHDFTPANRFNHQMRSAYNWQIMYYPSDYRDIIQWQQVQKYRVKSNTISAGPLGPSNYFLGYTIQPEIGAQIGQNVFGYMGSV